MSKLETCCACDEATGRAGIGEDSLYTDDGYGPFCEACWNIAEFLQPSAALSRQSEAQSAPVDAKRILTHHNIHVVGKMPDGTDVDLQICGDGAMYGKYMVMVALPVAQSAAGAGAALGQIEQYRMQMACISTAAIGYWKEGDDIHPDYDTVALRDVAKLYAKYAALHEAANAPIAAREPVAWTPGPNQFKDWCTQYFGPDADDDYLAKAVFDIPQMAQRFKYTAPPATQAVPSELPLDGLQKAADALQQFKRDWQRVPYFADRVNKATREAISMAIGPIVNLDAVGGPLDMSKYAAPAPAPDEPADPMDWPLPCDVKVGCGTHGKGTALRGLVGRMQRLYDAMRESDDKTPSVAPSVTVDGPEFDELLSNCGFEFKFDGDIGDAKRSLIAHIDAHTAAAVAAERKERDEMRAAMYKRNMELTAELAAARQAKPLTDEEMWAAAVGWAGTEEVGYSRQGSHTGIVCRTPDEIGDIFRAILAHQEKP